MRLNKGKTRKSVTKGAVNFQISHFWEYLRRCCKDNGLVRHIFKGNVVNDVSLIFCINPIY